jgi:hypothetical protein
VVENFVDIDDNIYLAIKKLNLLGYKTVFCCSGHTDNRGIQAYIYFDWKKDNKVFETLPTGWRYDSYSYRKTKHYKYNIIRSIIDLKQKQIDKLTEEQKQDIIDNSINNLIQWVEQLKQREE